jgi:hypothetical protein
MKMSEIRIGRLLRANTTDFVVGCRVNQLEAPAFGAMVRIPLGEGYQIYGLIYDIRIDDDGLVRQLVTAHGVDEAIIADNRVNRNVPVEMSVLTVGYQDNGPIRHLIPPRPALSLDVIYLCNGKELVEFTNAGRFGYFRHVLRATDVPVGELLAAHIQQANDAQTAAGNTEWSSAATHEVITLLRDDYPTLMTVLGALGDAVPD